MQEWRILRECILSERVDVKTNCRLHVGDRFIRRIALADNASGKPERICNEPIFKLLNDDLVSGRTHGGFQGG